jgi:hypothetical protein
MANITFAWMLDQISPYVSINETVVYQDSRARQNHIDDLNEQKRKYDEHEKEEEAKRSWAQWAGRALGSAADKVLHPLTKPEKPNSNRHDFGWGTGIIIDSYTMMYWPNGSKPRTPKAYAKDTKHTASGETNEEIHPTVGYRNYRFQSLLKEKLSEAKSLEGKLSEAKALEAKVLEVKILEDLQYAPMGLGKGKYKHLKYERRQDIKGKWEYLLGDVVLPEYVMPAKTKKGGRPTFERFALALAWEKTDAYVKALDEQNGFHEEDFD